MDIEKMRAVVAELETRIAAKANELKDDTPKADQERIEGEHDALVKERDLAMDEVAKATAPKVEERKEPVAPAVDVKGEVDAGIRAERKRIAEITAVADKFNMRDFAANAVIDGTSAAEFRAAVLDKLAAAPANVEGATVTGVRTEVSGENEAKRAQAMEVALLHRWSPVEYQKEFDANPACRDYRGLTLIEMARASLEERGFRTRGMSKDEVAREALAMRAPGQGYEMRAGGMLSTSDFPNLLANVLNKTLRAGYEAAPQTFRPLVRVTTVPDFKPVQRTQFGSAPKLELVNEHGEFHRGKVTDAAEKYQIATYGKVVAITRQTLINDDLSAFTRLPREFGVQASQLESDIVWSQILANANMGDGTALFASGHGNLAGSGAAISTVTADLARVAMGLQTSLDGKTVLNLVPITIVVPKAKQTAAELFRGTLYPTATSAVVPDFQRQFSIIAEPRLDNGVTINGTTYSGSSTAYYFFADVNQIDLIELAYLEGQQGLYSETRMGFDVDGFDVKVRMDLGAKAIDWRGMYKNAGA